MADFLSERNPCGPTLLRLVSRGNAIISELLRLADFIPPVFRMETREDQVKYKDVILDFAYFKSSELYDSRLESPELQDLDEEFRENHMEILTRFYRVFEGVHKFITDLNRFLEDLQDGNFIQQTLDTVLHNEDGKQLMAESVFLYGVMLTIIDQRIESPVRERMLVSYHRYSASESVQQNIDEVCKLLRGTGFSPAPGAKRPARYPEEYFARLAPPPYFVKMVISRLRSDDIYNQIAAFPHPDHRSAALATQAAMLYIILYFAPDILSNEQAQMREIVDKHFPDNWVLSIYMGMVVDLSDMWEPYKAARTALSNTLELSNVRSQLEKHIGKVPQLDQSVRNYLKQGVLERDFVLDNVAPLTHTMREANVTIRWLMLHTQLPRSPIEPPKRIKAVRDMIAAAPYDPKAVFDLLLNVSQYEFVLKNMFRAMLSEKQARWDALKREGADRMQELSDVFSGATPLSRVEKNENLQAYFSSISKQIGLLDYTDSTAAGRKIKQIIQALEEVQEFHQLEHSLQIRQFLAETQKSLRQMIRTINIREEALITFQIITDLSYAWELIDNFTGLMQSGIQADPGMVIKLRATFLKLSSALDLPLVRIQQSNSPDLVSVSQYYSSELVAYVRKVLQIIPEKMFSVLEKVIHLQTNVLLDIPTRLDKDKLKDFAQIEERAEVARLTQSISVFTEGILMMKATLVGVMKIDPKQLLEDGIRKELVRQVADAFDKTLFFNPKAKSSELPGKLQALAAKMAGFRRSFEYIQDYVNIYGLKIWQEEVSRIVGFNVEQECNSFLRTKIFSWQSVYQSKTIPVPVFQPVDESVNFVGRLARELLRITDPRTSHYVEQLGTWYEKGTFREIVTSKAFKKMQEAVGSFGLTGLDRFFAFMVVKELQSFQRAYTKLVKQDKGVLTLLGEADKVLSPHTAIPDSKDKVYNAVTQKAARVWQTFGDIVTKVGQLQLIRRLIAQELDFSCKFDSKFLSNVLETFNRCLLADVAEHYADPSKPYPGTDSPLLSECASYLEAAGLSDPLRKIYITTKKLDHFALAIFMVVVSQISRLAYSRSANTMTAKRPTDPIDGPPFVVGIVTLLRQFHTSHTHRFMALAGQYIRTLIDAGLLETARGPAPAGLPSDGVMMLLFVEEMTSYCQVSRKAAAMHVPTYLFDEYRHHA
eukprot:m.228184 g.228184  ORF g.228184 m.228184 type:complete len:1164 (+) comp17418_c0_seq1:49-3540(+)